jgi:hypothetical protein
MPTYLPFQFAATGSQTSKPICESLVGAANPAIRQKGTETFSPGGVPKRPGVVGTSKSGGALMAVAMVIVTFGMFSDARVSQDCCDHAMDELSKAPANRTDEHVTRRNVLMPPPSLRPTAPDPFCARIIPDFLRSPGGRSLRSDIQHPEKNGALGLDAVEYAAR